MISIDTIQSSRIVSYVELFKEFFPHQRFSEEFLNWLYFQNPEGSVIGFDAIFSGKVIGHYACIPTNIEGVRGMLSLNSVVSREFRGQGIFERLANLTYEEGKKEYRFVVGVANKQSENLFIDKLGFTKVGNLNLRFGNLNRVQSDVRKWSKDSIDWLLANPRSLTRVYEISENVYEVVAKSKRFVIPLKALLATKGLKTISVPKYRFGLTIDWNLGKKPKLRLPNFLKPAPLTLIIKTFEKESIEIKSWTCFDFDLL